MQRSVYGLGYTRVSSVSWKVHFVFGAIAMEEDIPVDNG